MTLLKKVFFLSCTSNLQKTLLQSLLCCANAKFFKLKKWNFLSWKRKASWLTFFLQINKFMHSDRNNDYLNVCILTVSVEISPSLNDKKNQVQVHSLLNPSHGQIFRVSSTSFTLSRSKVYLLCIESETFELLLQAWTKTENKKCMEEKRKEVDVGDEACAGFMENGPDKMKIKIHYITCIAYYLFYMHWKSCLCIPLKVGREKMSSKTCFFFFLCLETRTVNCTRIR